jgi:phage N-6-adenine-methyltransferase
MRKKNRRVIEPERFSSLTDEWGTPIDKFREWDLEFDFTLDPCGNKNRLLKENGFITWTKKDNGLIRSWEGQRVFVNPPYSDLDNWVKKIFSGRDRAELIVLLIYVRTDTNYFHEYIYHHSELRFLRGRCQFVNLEHPELGKNKPPHASMLCIYRRYSRSSQKKLIG